MSFISKIISGGQTGVDRGALETAIDLGFPYGGYVPKGRRSEDGIVPLQFAAMTEDTRKDYLHRTELNVVNSAATLILSRTRELSGGTKRTAEFCEKHGKSYWIDNPEQLNETDRGLEFLYWVEAEFGERGIALNVAGSREQKETGIQAARRSFVKRVLSEPFIDFMLERILEAIKDKSEEIKNVGVNVGVKLSARERDLLELIRLDGTLTARAIAETYSISTRQAERLLTGLKKKGFLVRKGSDKSGHWEVVS